LENPSTPNLKSPLFGKPSNEWAHLALKNPSTLNLKSPLFGKPFNAQP
jgi:hypothetical protein